MISPSRRRRLQMAGAILFFAAAATIAIGVIPAVRNDTFPAATPERAANAFLVNVVLQAAAAGSVLWRALAGRRSGRVTGIAGIVMGLALVDAASAFAGHGPEMRLATILLFGCAAMDFVAGALTIATAFGKETPPGGPPPAS